MGTVMQMKVERIIVEANMVPRGFLASLKKRGLIRNAEVKADGVIIETRAAVVEVMQAFEQAGITVFAVRVAGHWASWEHAARPAGRVAERLHNIRSSVWLPTLPAA
jgi:hypothetical protein